MNSDNYEDIELICICGQPFIWTKGEQAFMNALKDEGKIASVQSPRRCAPCRFKKKQERESFNN